MNRRQFMRLAALACVSGTAYGGWRWWPEQGLQNPCRASLPLELARHPLVRAAWEGIDASQVWDCHAHLFGNGDSGSGVWMNPSMYSLASPAQYVQRLFYMNAGCVHDAPGQVDRSVVSRLENLVEGLRPGVKVMLFAFDWCHDESGRPLREASAFYVPNAYAASVTTGRSTTSTSTGSAWWPTTGPSSTGSSGPLRRGVLDPPVPRGCRRCTATSG